MTAATIWSARVACDHGAVLAQAPTVEAWASGRPCGCATAEHVGSWQVGISAESATDRDRVRSALTSITEPTSVAGAVARLSRSDLPHCAVLLSDGEYAAGLAWGGDLALRTLGPWEYALTTTPAAGDSTLAPGTIVALDSCGPVIFSVPFLQELA